MDDVIAAANALKARVARDRALREAISKGLTEGLEEHRNPLTYVHMNCDEAGRVIELRGDFSMPDLVEAIEARVLDTLDKMRGID